MKNGFKFLIGVPVTIIRTFFILGFLLVIVVIGAGVAPLFFSKTTEPPATTEAPWAIQTYSYVRGETLPLRIYYAKEYSVINGQPAIAEYWQYNGKRYTFNDEILIFYKNKWGPISVIRRPM